MIKYAKHVIALFLVLILFFNLFINKKSDHKSLKLMLKGKTIIILPLGEKYKEPGFISTDEKGNDITDKVKIKGTVNFNKEGHYELVYEIRNSKNEVARAHRFISVKKVDQIIYKNSYENIDNTTRYWWSGNRFDYQRPAGGANINELKKYNTFFLGPDKKVLYLTFDEGSYQTYVSEIVSILNKNYVKGTFFLCKNFISANAELIKKMIEDGHSIGNHTYHHLSMPSLADKENFSKFLTEIKEVQDTFFKISGKEMDKIFRPPRGEWSFRSLQILKDLGYKTFFYSANYDDFSKTLSKKQALSEMVKRYHNGAIYLIHPNNKGNFEALEDFIIEMKKQGFSFGLVRDIEN